MTWRHWLVICFLIVLLVGSVLISEHRPRSILIDELQTALENLALRVAYLEGYVGAAAPHDLPKVKPKRRKP